MAITLTITMWDIYCLLCHEPTLMFLPHIPPTLASLSSLCPHTDPVLLASADNDDDYEDGEGDGSGAEDPQCTDLHPLCLKWADAGECDANPNYMVGGVPSCDAKLPILTVVNDRFSCPVRR